MGIILRLNVLSNSVLSLRFVNVMRISMRQHAERDIVLHFLSACLFVTLWYCSLSKRKHVPSLFGPFGRGSTLVF